MKIYLLEKDVDNFRSCFIKETKLSEDDLDNFSSGEPLDFNEGCITFRLDEEKGLKTGDVFTCWDFVGFLINERTSELFSKNEKINAQFVKFQDDIILFNNLEIVDALDEEKTEYEYFEGDIIDVEKYVFKKMEYPPLFQLKLPNGYVPLYYFVTDEFIKIVNDNNLKGFLFKEVWDSGNQ